MLVRFIFGVVLVMGSLAVWGQTATEYEISFANAAHHEAEIKATFTNLESKVLAVRMSRTSPGRYAVHEFAKNVYNVRATDGQGKALEVTRPNPHQWDISGHDGTVKLSYTLFADRGDGTYSQVDETHAHLNIPATFMYAPALWQRPVKVRFVTREDLNWRVATQLKPLGDNVFYAPGLHYFMDSPTEVSDHAVREWTQTSGGKAYTIRFVLHHRGTDAELDEYVEKVKRIVEQEKQVYGELPDYDYGTYTFLACYLDNVSGDGMEHRNSTILTDRESLAEGGMEGNIGTVSHEFFHCWNVERIRPLSLEPFDYTEANMSGELWFAEGFTSYYTGLILCRAGVITPEEYVNGLAGAMNYVWTTPGRTFFNPIEMSYRAPFVDAASSIDPVSNYNTFTSYYSYGSVLGLALDLQLRKKELNLDAFMQLMWTRYGKTEIPYTVRDIQATLAAYAGKELADTFFEKYIFHSEKPDYEALFATVGVVYQPVNPDSVKLGISTRLEDNRLVVASRPNTLSTAYAAGLEQGDVLLSLDGKPLMAATDWSGYRPGQMSTLEYERYGELRTTRLVWQADTAYEIKLLEQLDKKLPARIARHRAAWLGGE